MKRLFFTLLLLLFVCASVFSENNPQIFVETQNLVQLSETELDFGIVFANQTDSLSFWIKNNGSVSFTANSFQTFQSEFFVKINSLTVPAGDSALVYVYCKAKHNLNYYDFLVIENSSLNESLVLPLQAQIQYTGTYYLSTQNLSGTSLKTALFNLVNNHNSLGYDGARLAMFTVIDKVADSVECVYTGRKVHVTTSIPSANPPTSMNTEHTWPQSMGAEGTAKSDLNHLFPTDTDANSQRGNYPFGVVDVNVTWSQGGSKKGTNTTTNSTVFEPRNVHKGDVARGMFYFSIRYDNPNNFIASGNQEATFRNWNVSDPVSTKEINRNNLIANSIYQGKRNPFIDHPEFIERIASFSGNADFPTAPELAVSPASCNFLTVAAGDSSDFLLTVVNSGNANLTLSNFQVNGAFSVVNSFSSVPGYDFRQIKIRFKPTNPLQNYSANLTFQSNDANEGNITVALLGVGGSVEVGERVDFAKDFSLKQNFPNPFNPTTKISYELGSLKNGKLLIFNVRGQNVKEFLIEKPKGSVVWNGTDEKGEQVSSGIYFYQLKTENFSETKKMVLLK
ncbi:endonuclease [bacterium]|nr:endonuclease [bacterium]